MNETSRPIDGTQPPELDPLTGLRTLSSLQQIAEAHMQPGCALLVGDLNSFRRINENLGHLAGDDHLKKAAELLQYMTRGQDMPARTGGDEFAIFLQRITDAAQLRTIAERIESRFASYSEGTDEAAALTITMAGTMYKPGDTFQSMFERAGAMLKDHKADASASDERDVRHSWERDLNHIRRELTEELTTKGAFARDFESFKSIYRFLARYKYRGSLDVCVLLLSLTEPDETTVPLPEKDLMMQHLDDILRHCLRLGDVYTQYSSSQFLVLAIEASPIHGDIIADRIRTHFESDNTGKALLIHECYELAGVDTPEGLPL